jgi:hypothetical protein
VRLRALFVMVSVILAVAVVPVASGADGISTTLDGRFSGTGSIAAGQHLDVVVLGRGLVPDSGVAAVVLNVTVTEGTASSFVTVWPTGQPQPPTSNVNFVAGQTVANTVIVAPGIDGQVSLGNHAGNVQVVVDVTGWMQADGPFHPVAPARLADSRVGYPTVDGQVSGTGAFAPGAERTMQVAGRGGVPAQGVLSVALNVTVTNPTAPGFLTVWPDGQSQPLTSNVNFRAEATVANMVIVPLDADGRIDVYNYAGSTDVVVDVLGWFSTTGTTFTPARLLDTRLGSPTTDGQQTGIGPITAASPLQLPLAGRVGIPADATAAIINVTVTNPTADGFLTLWSARAPKPNASTINFVAGQTVANMTILGLGVGNGTEGMIDISNYAGHVDVVVDVLGWFVANGSFRPVLPARLVDTRPVPGTPPAAPGTACNWRTSVHDQEGAGDQLYTYLYLTNTTTHECAAPHVNEVTGRTVSGKQVTGTEQSGFGSPTTSPVAPGASVQAVLNAPTNSDACGLPLDPLTNVTIDIGTTIVVALPRHPDGACGQLGYTQVAGIPG